MMRERITKNFACRDIKGLQEVDNVESAIRQHKKNARNTRRK